MIWFGYLMSNIWNLQESVLLLSAPWNPGMGWRLSLSSHLTGEYGEKGNQGNHCLQKQNKISAEYKHTEEKYSLTVKVYYFIIYWSMYGICIYQWTTKIIVVVLEACGRLNCCQMISAAIMLIKARLWLTLKYWRLYFMTS